MLKITAAVCGLLLVLGACGRRESTPRPQPDAAPPSAPAQPDGPVQPPAQAGRPAEEPAEEPSKGGDETFVPPPDWCGTPGMWKQPAPKSAGFAVFGNDKGEELRVPLDKLAPAKEAELRKAGWTLKMKLSGWTLK